MVPGDRERQKGGGKGAVRKGRGGAVQRGGGVTLLQLGEAPEAKVKDQ